MQDEEMQNAAGAFTRDRGPVIAVDDTFRINQTKHTGQYYSAIFFRLKCIGPVIKDTASRKCPSTPIVTNVLDAPLNRETIVFGTIFKEMKLKPNILDQYGDDAKKQYLGKANEDDGSGEMDGKKCLCQEDDVLYLEDENGRLVITGIPVERQVTGVVMGLRGVMDGNSFNVRDIIYAGMAPQQPLQLPTEERYIALISGLQVGHSSGNPVMLEMLFDFLCGFAGLQGDHQSANKIARVVLAGNSLVEDTTDWEEQLFRQQGKNKLASPVEEPLTALDNWLTQLLATIQVDLMPGETDPTPQMMPQRGLNRALLQKASLHNTLALTTNPYRFQYSGATILGTSGQNITDMQRVARADSNLDFLEMNIRSRCTVPTAPDTLACYPFREKDPFLLTECPSVYFVGNMSKYETKLLTGENGQRCRIIAIPEFYKTGQIVLLNMTNLECVPYTFSVPPDAMVGMSDS